MEIGGISSAYLNQSWTRTGLTDDQRTTLEEIFAKYDPENMTLEERESLQTELREAGVAFCREVRQSMQAAGFASTKVQSDQLPSGGPQGPAPKDEKGEAALADALNKYESGELTEDELIELLQEYAQSGILTAGSLVNELA